MYTETLYGKLLKIVNAVIWGVYITVRCEPADVYSKHSLTLGGPSQSKVQFFGRALR